MNIEQEKPKIPSLSEFLNIYPPLSKNSSNLNDSKKFFNFFGPLKRKSMRLKNQNDSSVINSYPYLVEKILKQQKAKIPRTQEVKDAIKNFLYNSNLIQKLKTYFSNENTNDNLVNLNEHIDTVITKLVGNVILEKYEENKLVIKFGDIGHNCFFLLSGKISILKPIEYKNIKISYHDYLKYLSNLYSNKEKCIALKVIELNNDNFFTFHNLENIRKDITNLKSFIKSYCIFLLYSKIKSNIINFMDISLIEENLKEFNLSLEDFGIKENEIRKYIDEINNKKDNNNKENQLEKDNLIKKYILENLTPSEDDLFNMKPYKSILFKNNSQNDITNFATLYKYDNFLYLSPGSFFGEMALGTNSNNNKRNATIRTEEECFMFSLTQKLYNSILVQSINLIKEYDISFIKKNYFFYNISPKNFDKKYFQMFKLISKEKNEIIYKQNSLLNSIFFLKEGKIKFEANLSVIDIHNIIRYYINYLTDNRRLFNFTNEQIYELNQNYLNNNEDLYLGNKPPIFQEKICEIKKYEIYNVTNFEVIGLLEFMAKMDKYNTSCIAVSKNIKVFEINKENMDNILKREKIVINDLYKFAKNRFLIMIKRLYSIKFNYLSNIFYKIKENFFVKNEYNFFKEDEKNDVENNSLDATKSIENTEKNNSSIYKNIQTSPKNNKIRMKKIELPYTNRNDHYLGSESQKNNFSEVSFRSIKFNENFFNKNKIHRIKLINKTNEYNSNKSKFNESSNSLINTLLSNDSKKNISKNIKSPLKLKKLNFKQNHFINIGNNNIFSFKKLKSKFNENHLDKKVFDLSIVKNDNRIIKKIPTFNNEFGKFHIKKSFSPSYFHNKQLKKMMLFHNENFNFSDMNIQNLTPSNIKYQ